jgi:hypothetical protein
VGCLVNIDLILEVVLALLSIVQGVGDLGVGTILARDL